MRWVIATWGLLACALLAGCAAEATTTAPDGVASAEGPFGADVPDDLAEDPAHKELVNRPAPDFAADGWVNGEPKSLTALRGKVVLLDFWAVWCGPCIRTFPHLREWADKYQADGLEIVGVTDYCQMDFDDASGESTDVAGLPPEEERAAIGRFAKHHELQHRLAVIDPAADPNPNRLYGVSGIPQVVLIDRRGKVRMVKVGSGPDNARDLEAMIQKLLAET